MVNSRALQWINSNGGPLLLLPSSLLGVWEGADEPEPYRGVEARSRWNPGGPATDYDRACDATELVGTVQVGVGEGLVLADEPLATTWWPAPEIGGGILVRWEYADSDAAAGRWIAAIPGSLPWEPSARFGFAEGPLVLFDSAEAGADPSGPRLEIALAGGGYDVHTIRWRPDVTTSLLLHRLKLRAAAA
jgi:Immunity protein 21